MKTLVAVAIGGERLSGSGHAARQIPPQSPRPGSMWGAGWMGGYGGFWGPALLVLVVAAVVVWVVKQKGK